MSKYRTIQLTNTATGAVATGAYMPLGIITRRLICRDGCAPAYAVDYSGSDVISINDVGYYNLTYNASLTAEAAGTVAVALIVGGQQVYQVTETAAAEGDIVNITLPYQIRTFCNDTGANANVPVAVRLQLTGAITAGTSNLIVERVY